MSTNPAPLKVLYIGGTGIISSACVRRSAAEGMNVYALNRGINAKGRVVPEGVHSLVADVTDDDALLSAIEGLHFDAVVNFLSFDEADSARFTRIFTGRTNQYVHISSASVYRRPILQVPVVESTLLENKFVAYSRDKIDTENVLLAAYREEGFPVTIVRPSHTYDEAHPPLPGDWTVFDRIERGAEIVVPGDGTSLWTVTHADDLAQGLVGLLGNPKAIGEAFHITSNDVYTWDTIYTMIAEALGVEAKLIHVPSEFFTVAAPDWFWSELIVGDLSHSALFDNSKIRSLVPGFFPTRTFHRSVIGMVEWRREHPVEAAGDPAVEGFIDRLAEGYHRSREVFASLAP
ncbi:NAD-dependent epimerase/dehydratase family protein [Amnibacterium flavum]|uniref:Nucleotide sugar epimerase n=1 Tax=Amnibacterium flavum TaxID=2173173 RepID=A0A2V1HTA6_9MICO|nr:NAD-dependent epimerase/dehydratase family protein [Amnibacterium flavum]PVZ93324.1 nucleotide sugar epimerase [Amnibacterium flavum]